MRKHNYLVGYRGENQCVYGDQKLPCEFTTPMTLTEAEKLSREVNCREGKKIIRSVVYKLVEVK